MEKILKIALDAEQKAQSITAQALKEKELCDKNIAQTDKIREEYFEKTKARIAEFEEREKLKTQIQCEKLDKKLADNTEKLERLYKTSGGQWIDAMYRQITEKL